MQRYWFKAKTYGWGWTPATWQGWAVTVFYIGLVTGTALAFLRPNHGIAGWIGYIASVAGSTVLLFVVCYKTGEKPAWRWGEEKQ